MMLSILPILVLRGLPAVAQERQPIDIERFKPALTYDGFIVTEGSEIRPLPERPKPEPADPDESDADPSDGGKANRDGSSSGESNRGRFQMGFSLNGSFNPFVLGYGQVGPSVVERYVGRRVGIDLFGSATVVRWASVGVGLPIFMFQTGQGSPNTTGVGDLRIVPKARLLRLRNLLGLAIITELRLPTHSDEEFSGGARAVVFAPRLIVDVQTPLGLRIGTNVGLLFRPATVFENVTAGRELTYTAAVAYSPGGRLSTVAFGLDVHGAIGLAGSGLEELPLEAQLFAQARVGRSLDVQAGPALGLLPGYGTPTFRLFSAFRWSPTPRPRNDQEAAPDDDRNRLWKRRNRSASAERTPVPKARVRVDDGRSGTSDPGTHVVDAASRPRNAESGCGARQLDGAVPIADSRSERAPTVREPRAGGLSDDPDPPPESRPLDPKPGGWRATSFAMTHTQSPCRGSVRFIP